MTTGAAARVEALIELRRCASARSPTTSTRRSRSWPRARGPTPAPTSRTCTRAWFEVAYNYAMFANEGGQYDELLAYIKEHRLS